MKTIKRTYKVYEFKELSQVAKEKAKNDYYEKEDFPFLEEDLTQSCADLLAENKIKEIDNSLKLFYSLSYSQGDGLCFIGHFKWKGYTISIKHNYKYYFAESVDITIMNEEREIDNEEIFIKFKSIYLKICKQVEKEGYSILEYRMDDKDFQEYCESNEYYFFESGKLFNL